MYHLYDTMSYPVIWQVYDCHMTTYVIYLSYTCHISVISLDPTYMVVWHDMTGIWQPYTCNLSTMGIPDVHTRLYIRMYIPCTYHVYMCMYICRNVYTCMYMFMIFTTCIYHVCQLLYYSIVHTLYIHGTDVSVHVYARWSGFQMEGVDLLVEQISWFNWNYLIY